MLYRDREDSRHSLLGSMNGVAWLVRSKKRCVVMSDLVRRQSM